MVERKPEADKKQKSKKNVSHTKADAQQAEKRLSQVVGARQKQKEQQLHYMYVLVCADDTLYTGYTTDVDQRIAKHNTGKGAKYTARRLPVRLLASAKFTTKHEAMSAEYHFKQLSRPEKLSLIGRIEARTPFEAILAERFGSAIAK